MGWKCQDTWDMWDSQPLSWVTQERESGLRRGRSVGRRQTWVGSSAASLGTHYRADEGTFGMMSKYLLFSHTQSSSSVSATNSQENRAVHGFLYAFASSMVT